MKQLFMQHTVVSCAMIFLLVLSIACQIIIGLIYQNMIKETDNMSSTENKMLKQCKLKFANCFQMNGGVSNIAVFVDKFLNRIRFCGITMTGLHHLSGQLILLSVFAAGIGACRGIIKGEAFRQILPFYIFSFFGLYVYFSVTALIDIQSKRRVLKTNLVDYLENHMVSRLYLNMDELAAQEKEKKSAVEKTTKKSGYLEKNGHFGKKEQEELEELLQEFLNLKMEN